MHRGKELQAVMSGKACVGRGCRDQSLGISDVLCAFQRFLAGSVAEETIVCRKGLEHGI